MLIDIKDLNNLVINLDDNLLYKSEKDKAGASPVGMSHELVKDSEFYKDLLDLCFKTYPQLKGYKPYRAYINYFVAREMAYFHVDSKRENEYTVLIYVNAFDKDEGGETKFYDAEKDTTIGVLPKVGRMVLFDAALEHTATPFRSHPRYTIAFKFKPQTT